MVSRRLLPLLFTALLISACSDDSKKPFLKIVGGGFTNNVASNIVTYSVVAKRLKKLPSGSVIEAIFDLPDSNRKFITSQPTHSSIDKYLFESEPLHGLQKGKPLSVKLRLLDTTGGKELAAFERSFTSNEDQ